MSGKMFMNMGLISCFSEQELNELLNCLFDKKNRKLTRQIDDLAMDINNCKLSVGFVERTHKNGTPLKVLVSNDIMFEHLRELAKIVLNTDPSAVSDMLFDPTTAHQEVLNIAPTIGVVRDDVTPIASKCTV